MKQSIKLVIWLAVFAVILVGAVFAYKYLSKNYIEQPAEQSSQDPSSEVQSTLPEGSEEPSVIAAVDIVVEDMQGSEVNLQDFYGKPIVMNFWATWCGPCQSELPDFEQIYQQYGQDVIFMMINLTDGDRETKETVEQFIKENNYTFPVYLDTRYDGAITYGAFSIPLTVIIDKQANIAFAKSGVMTAQELEQIIVQLIP